MQFNKDDWFSMGGSLVLHLVLLLMLSLMMGVSSEETPVGFIEVDFGPFAEGRPVVSARPQLEDFTHGPEEADPQEEEQPAVAPPEEVRPVDLPEQVVEIDDSEVVDIPEAETIAPDESQAEEDIVDEVPQPATETIQPLGSGSLTDIHGDEPGDAGDSNDPEKSSPFQIEGLNRVPVSTPLPVYSEQVNAIIQVRIVVDPQGRLIRRIPLLKGNASLEKAVMDALLRWRFNPLPANAPQENQTGQVTFRFTLR
ncbi:MAG: energy transducer TonB [Rhodothermia bacterium]|nr:MAG: energy transducer TonB [Rhodothermia bacterium]